MRLKQSKNGLNRAQWKNIEHIITVQRDLGMALDKVSSLQESLQLCLKAAIEVSGLDAGGIYLLDQENGDFNLILTMGHTDEFARINSKFQPDSPQAKIIMTGEPFYQTYGKIRDDRTSGLLEEEMLSFVAIPFVDKGRVTGSLHVGSHFHNTIPQRSRNALETIARQIGAAISRAQAEQNLKASEEKYRAIFENALEGIFQTTPEGLILTANPAMASLFGYASPADLIHNVASMTQLYANPDDRLTFQREIAERGAVNEYGIPCVHRDGPKIWIAVNAKAVRDQEGNIIRYDGYFEDITLRKKIEDDLRQSEELLRSIVETSRSGIIMMTIRGKILFANRAMAEMLGYRVEELVGTRYTDYIHPDEKENVIGNVRLLQNDDPVLFHNQRRFICRNGIERWGYVSVGNIDDVCGKHHVTLVISDMTQLKQIEKEKKQLEDHLRQAQKMEAIGTLAGGIAHDFNNILASMMGYTEMAARETRQDVRRNYLSQVLQACERAKNLVNQILSFSRMREQERKPLDIKLILQEAVSLLRASLPATIKIKQEITAEETNVLADSTQIHQIIMNLCTNAAQAMREKGGVLTMHLSNMTGCADGIPGQPDLKAAQYVRLSVQDTGHGIDPAIRDKIFEPFFTTKRGKEGTGLGLSVVYGIIKSYEGAIDFQSSPGWGTTFAVYLPSISGSNRVEKMDQVDIDVQGCERILFVDDEEALVNMARTFLQSLGYRVTATASSAEALRLFQEDPAAFDLVITDMTMPEITGLKLSRTLLSIRPELSIILCSGYADSISIEEIRKLNIREFARKPLMLRELGLMVRHVLDSSK